MKGIDVSSYWKGIDWNKVKADGVEFAMIKASQGHSVNDPTLYLFTDSMFKNHLSSASSVGIACGVYHYLTAKDTAEAKKEAQYFIETIRPYKNKIKLWAAVDVEEESFLPNNKITLTAAVKVFCQEVKDAGFEPMIYTNPNFIQYRLLDISQYPLWLALYRDKDKVPTNYPNMKIWQYGYDVVAGIKEKVDADLGYFTMEKTYAQQTEIDKSWAKEDIKWALDNKIMLGDNNGKLNLKDPVTREQMCAFLHRLYDLMKGQ